MNLFEIVKYGVSCRDAAERYGVEVNHYGMALCPFHNDRHPSLYVADDHYHCFACGEHGDVIDFVSKLFRLSLYDAAQKLAADFHLTPDKPPSAAALHAKRIQTEAQQLRENERLCFSVLSDYARVLQDWKVRYDLTQNSEAGRVLLRKEHHGWKFERICHVADFSLANVSASPIEKPIIRKYGGKKLMKSNLRNEIKSYIVRQGMTMQEVVDLLRDEHGWSDSVSNLSNKLQRESLRYVEAVQLADALDYEIVWQKRR